MFDVESFFDSFVSSEIIKLGKLYTCSNSSENHEAEKYFNVTLPNGAGLHVIICKF